MDLEMSSMISALNYLYQEGLNGDKIEQKKFTDYVTKVRSNEIKFLAAKPDIDYGQLALNEYEFELFRRLQFVKSEMLNAKENELFNFYKKMSDAESELIHELSTLLMKRGEIRPQYFWLYSDEQIAFNWSGHAMDLYVWLEEN